MCQWRENTTLADCILRTIAVKNVILNEISILKIVIERKCSFVGFILLDNLMIRSFRKTTLIEDETMVSIFSFDLFSIIHFRPYLLYPRYSQSNDSFFTRDSLVRSCDIVQGALNDDCPNNHTSRARRENTQWGTT